ncbi:MAG: PE-PGRS family protein, partial [Parcubacteria group bacterium GW2011_GWC1_42_11]
TSYTDAGGGLADTFFIKRSTGNVGIGTVSPAQKLSVAGIIESTSGGIKFPDSTVQTTAAAGGVTPPAGSEFLDTSATAQTKVGTLIVGGLKIPGGTTGKVLISDAVGNASWGTNPVSTVSGGMLPRESFYNNVAFNGTQANVFTAPAGVTEVIVEVFGSGGGGGAGYIGGSNGATGGTSSFGPTTSPFISATSGSGGGVGTSDGCWDTCTYTNGAAGASGTGSGGYVNSRLYSLDQFGSGGSGGFHFARGGTGGRGGYSKGIVPVTPGTTYTVTVGTGGAGGCYYGYYCGSAGSNGFVRVSYLGDVTLTPLQKCANAGGMALDANGNCTYTYSNLMGTFGWSRELRNGDGQYVCANAGGKPTWTYLSNTTSTHGTSCGGNYGLVYWGGTSFVNWGEFGGICGGNITVESTVTCKVPM